MINLIPNQDKKKMIKSFYFRLTILSLWMLCIPLLILILVLLPSYFFSNYKNNLATKKLETQKAEQVPLFDQETTAIIQEINTKLKLIEGSQKNNFLPSEKVINAILIKNISSIKITQISYDNNSTNGKKIRISGTAPSREVLLTFRQSLENDKAFKSVELPISNFVKGSNIQFYLSLTPA